MREVNASTRAAQRSDDEPVAALLGELGYPSGGEEVRERLARLLDRDDAGVIVAESGGEVVGVAAYQLVWLLERSRPQCRLTALVVGADHRRRAVAGRLLAEVEAVARAADCFRLEVTTQPGRDDAHAFYSASGFVERPRRMVKPL